MGNRGPGCRSLARIKWIAYHWVLMPAGTGPGEQSHKVAGVSHQPSAGRKNWEQSHLLGSLSIGWGKHADHRQCTPWMPSTGIMWPHGPDIQVHLVGIRTVLLRGSIH